MSSPASSDSFINRPMEDLKNIIESLLFVADEPLNMDRFKKIIEQATALEIRTALKELAADYENRGGGFHLREVAGGFQIRSRPAYNDWIKRLVQPNPIRLSRASLETLAIIAYKQPIIRADIEHIRGVDCGGILRTLLERKLIRVLGRKEIPGRPIIYATTRHFLEVFDLKDLKDLPTPKEIEALGHPDSEEMILKLEAADAAQGADAQAQEGADSDQTEAQAGEATAPEAPADSPEEGSEPAMPGQADDLPDDIGTAPGLTDDLETAAQAAGDTDNDRIEDEDAVPPDSGEIPKQRPAGPDETD